VVRVHDHVDRKQAREQKGWLRALVHNKRFWHASLGAGVGAKVYTMLVGGFSELSDRNERKLASCQTSEA
jgi:hypothetical protein